MFRLCITTTHPPFPTPVTLTTAAGRTLCTTELQFLPFGARFSCVLPGSRVLTMTLTRGGAGQGATWVALIGGREVQGIIRGAR